MKQDNLGNKVLSGLFWKFSERMAAQLVSFIVSIVLARLLAPEDYGAIALITVFITIANVFVVSGFGNSLIQKKNADNLDFSTVFFFNIFFSWFVYFIVFLFAPYVASYYQMEVLKPALRVLALKIVLAGVNSVQQAYVSRNMLFKRFFVSTSIGTVVSAFVGIFVAVFGGGIWALVAQQLCNAVMDTIILWITVKWRPYFSFSWSRLKGLLNYGWKILATNLINTLYDNLKNLIIGKKYTSSDLAFYSKGKQFPELIVTNINSSIGSVLFPAMSLIQDDKKRLKDSIRKAITISSFIMLPLMAGLFVMADEIVVLLLTDKWIECVPYLRIACVYMATYPINTANLQALNAIGRSDFYLKLEILKRGIGVLLILLTFKFGVFYLACSDIIVSLLAIVINTYPNKTLLNYSLCEQIIDLIPNVLRTVIMAVFVFITNMFIKRFINRLILNILIEVIIGAVVYLLISYLSKSKELTLVFSKIKSILRK